MIPNTLPVSLRDQLLALLPYGVDRRFYMEGMIELVFRVPDDMMLAFNLDTTIMEAHGIQCEISRGAPNACVDSFDEPPITIPDIRYTDIKLILPKYDT